MSNDPYIKLASEITGRPESRITADLRRETKQAFFRALLSISELPGNEQLSRALAGKSPLIRKGDEIEIAFGAQQNRVSVTHVEAHIITTADIEE